MAKGSLLIQQKGNQWPSSCFPTEAQSLSAVENIPNTLSVNPELRQGIQLQLLHFGGVDKGKNRNVLNNVSFLHLYLKTLWYFRPTSSPLWSSRSYANTKPTKFSPIHFVFLPLPPLSSPPSSYCSDYLFSMPSTWQSLAFPLLDPTLHGREKKAINKKLKATMEIQDLILFAFIAFWCQEWRSPEWQFV